MTYKELRTTLVKTAMNMVKKSYYYSIWTRGRIVFTLLLFGLWGNFTLFALVQLDGGSRELLHTFLPHVPIIALCIHEQLIFFFGKIEKINEKC